MEELIIQGTYVWMVNIEFLFFFTSLPVFIQQRAGITLHFSVLASEIVCQTSPWSPQTEFYAVFRRKRSTVTGGTVNVTLDNARLSIPDIHFTYMDDPEITDVYPRRSFIR